MSENTKKSSSWQIPLPISVLVSWATGPMLGLLVGGKALSEVLFTISEASEDIWQGDRLPILPVTNHLNDDAD